MNHPTYHNIHIQPTDTPILVGDQVVYHSELFHVEKVTDATVTLVQKVEDNHYRESVSGRQIRDIDRADGVCPCCEQALPGHKPDPDPLPISPSYPTYPWWQGPYWYTMTTNTANARPT